MKKQIIALMGVTILTIGILSGCGGRNESNSNTDTTEEVTSVQDTTDESTSSQDSSVEDTTTDEATSMANSENIISEDEAKNIAFEDAGVNEADVTRIRVSRDYDDGRQEYDVDFYVGTQEYEYTISAEDGAILEKDTDIDNDFD